MAGVEGCKRREVYVFSGNAWLLNPAPSVETPRAPSVGIVPSTGDVVVVP
ncbi:MAG: hypothetical protein MUC96_34880 [Myxococcaceae bacterium]|jgi:hypothetical protein|nr:hypothetical protein [Myxococcaceae bacterium]